MTTNFCHKFCVSSCLLWNSFWVLCPRGTVVSDKWHQAAGVHTETLHVVQSVQSHLLSCGGWIQAAKLYDSVGNEGYSKPSIRSSNLLLRSQMRIISSVPFWYCSPAVILCLASFSSRHCCFPNPVLWHMVNQLRACWVILLWCCLTSVQFEVLIESTSSSPLQAKQKFPNWRNGQAPIALNRHNLELLEHLIFYKPWIWKCVCIQGHMWWSNNWKLLEHFSWEALGTSQLSVAWGKARCPDDMIFKSTYAQEPLDFYVLFPYWWHYQKLSHTLSLI